LPGETVTIQNGAVTVSNREFPSDLILKEDYLLPGIKTSGNISKKLGDAEYFVLGDNRNYSFDSRSWGPLDKKYVIGIARLRLLPITKAQAFSY
jgi:signal peptidase I